MALRAVATGMIAEPVLRWTPQQKAVLDLRINATASARDKASGQWADIGGPLWVGATFWDDEAKHLADILSKGDRVSIEGTLVVETFQRRDGTEGQKHIIRFPRFLGMIPGRRQSAEDAGAYGGAAQSPQSTYVDAGPPQSGPIPRVDGGGQGPMEAPF